MTGQSDTPAIDALSHNERHNTVAETRYWCNQYKNAAKMLERELTAANQRIRELRAPAVLFDGYTVFNALTERARLRTSAENVSDVLDAVVKLLRLPKGDV